MNIIITGSTGFIGRHLVPLLLKNNHVILELTRSIEKSKICFSDTTSKYQISEDQQLLKQTIQEFKPNICIHLASFLTSVDDYDSMRKLIDTNIVFLSRLLDALKESGLELFINTGTFAEYYKGNNILDPAYLYSATKTASRSFIDYYSKAYGFKQLTVVPYTIYGDNDSQKKIIDIIYDSIESEDPIELSPGTQILDFIHINDVVDFYLNIINYKEQIETKTNFQLGTGNGINLKQLANIVEEVSGRTTNIVWGGKSYRPTDIMYAVADITNIDFWKPKINIRQGVKIYLNNKSMS